jgi:dTDP-4-amino-4,6-dideoxygalactose transaminase
LASAARRVIQRADLPSITARRRAVYARLHERLIALPGIRSFAGALGEEVCPWAYPFLPEEREGLDRRLRDRGIQVFTFGDPVGDAAERTRYPRAVSYRERVLLLPSHQGLTDEDVDRMADTLAQVIR